MTRLPQLGLLNPMRAHPSCRLPIRVPKTRVAVQDSNAPPPRNERADNAGYAARCARWRRTPDEFIKGTRHNVLHGNAQTASRGGSSVMLCYSRRKARPPMNFRSCDNSAPRPQSRRTNPRSSTPHRDRRKLRPYRGFGFRGRGRPITPAECASANVFVKRRAAALSVRGLQPWLMSIPPAGNPVPARQTHAGDVRTTSGTESGRPLRVTRIVPSATT